MLKWLTVGAVTLAALWGGWWVFGSQAVERGAVAAIAEARAQGWSIAYEDLSVAGFPSRFDTTVTAPRVTTPDGAFEWSAPFVQVFALAYRSDHIIAVAPPTMSFELPGEAVDVTNDDLRGSVIVSGSPPVLDRSTLTAEALRVTLADLWLRIETGQVSTRQAGTENVHQIAASLTDVTFSDALRDLIDPAGDLPDRVTAITLDAEVGLSDAIGPGRTPQVQTVLLRRAEMQWGETRANLTGEMTAGGDGSLTGSLILGLRNWEPLVRNAAAQGLLTSGEATILNAGIAGLIDGSGEAQVPVTLTEGRLNILGLPVATLPRL